MKKILAFLTAVAVAAPAGALEWTSLGARSVGMGGAGVALAQGPLASYWNPAALGRATENAYGVQIPVVAHYGVTGSVVEGANDLQHLKDSCSSGAADCTQANITAALVKVNEPGNGARVDAGVGGDFKIGRLAFFANGLAAVGAVPQADLVNTAPTNFDGVGTQNGSKLTVKGARILEFGAGYGRELGFAPGLFLGAAVKLMNAQVGYSDYVIIQNSNSDDFISSLKNSVRTSANFGVDAGLLWDLQRAFDAPLHPRFGLVGRNLNNPKFSQPDSAVAAGLTDKFAVNPQARAGLSLSPFHWWNFAADIDVTRNLTPVDNVASRQLGVGTEINVFNRSWINIPLRLGASRNLAETGSGTMISAGAGLNFLHVIVDVSGSVSPKTVSVQSQGKTTTAPREASAALQLSFLFGGSEDGGRRASEAVPAAQVVPVEQIRANADKAQQDLDAEAAKP
ncbi:MAG: conjugal transfer protein TraF [Elusimicrobia bacterium]|nr:conjugal transfer protein TraF [Elusimicrobiota bacterium]